MFPRSSRFHPRRMKQPCRLILSSRITPDSSHTDTSASGQALTGRRSRAANRWLFLTIILGQQSMFCWQQ